MTQVSSNPDYDDLFHPLSALAITLQGRFWNTQCYGIKGSYSMLVDEVHIKCKCSRRQGEWNCTLLWPAPPLGLTTAKQLRTALMCPPSTGTSPFLLTPSCLPPETASRTTDKLIVYLFYLQSTRDIQDTFSGVKFLTKTKIIWTQCTIPLISPPRITEIWPNLHRSSEN